jgi:putative SOS response-associated peptidase YedK
MCGRYSLSTPGEDLAAVFGLSEALEVEARFTIAPSQPAPIVREGRRGRRASLCRWGLIPYWADDASVGNRMINARSETASEKPAYREAWRRRRCLVPADGFYEWKREGRHRQPWYFSHPTGEPLAFAGLWDRWAGGEAPVESYTVLTTAANPEVAAVHDRMPVILPASAWARWLSTAEEGSESLLELLRPLPAGSLAAWPVSPYVNNPANEGSRCIEAVEATPDAREPQRSLF